jgi:mono/diheme cytochrome c family protein
MSSWRLVLGASVSALALAACGPGRPDRGHGRASAHGAGAHGRMGPGGGGMMGGGMMGGRDTGAAPRPAPARAPAVAGCPAVDERLVAAGRAVFTGGGNCQSCHGADARGTPIAPDLTDDQWLNIDGSYGSIAQLVRTGVPRPKQYAAPMPPMGGASLTPEQVCAVAGYVYSLGH